MTTADKKLNVLIIDDEPIVLESVSVYLNDSGFHVLMAANGRIGLTVFREKKPDIVLVDLRMPEIDGLEVLAAVTAEAPEIPIVVISGTGDMQDVLEALHRGAWDFVTKPIQDMAVLEHAVRKALERARLRVENRRYRAHLEEEILKRTADLKDRTQALENNKRQLEREMSERLAAEQSLRRSNERLDLALSAARHALWDYNLVTGRIYLSPRFFTMFGYAPNEMSQDVETWYDLIHPDEQEPLKSRMADIALGSVATFEIEYRMRTKSQDWRWVLCRARLVEKDESGRAVRVIGTHVDITRRRLNVEELKTSQAHLRKENLRLRSSLKGGERFGRIVGKSRVMREVYELILKAAFSRANVIIYGESGTGKELVAQTIHELSDRSAAQFVTVNCGAIPDNLVESEFFGYKKGAFTGAALDNPGYLSSADGGTLFLDEVGELDLNLQAKLLRAIDGGGYTPIGSTDIKTPDVRFIAATNRDLQAFVKQGRLREDFFYRIHIIPIHLPPLRERREDIAQLVYHFLSSLSEDDKVPAVPADAMKMMQHYDWPGNVRELQNSIHRYLTLNKLDFMDASSAGSSPAETGPAPIIEPTGSNRELHSAMARFEREFLQQVLHEHQWHRGRAAAALDINRKTLFKKIKQYGISKAPK